MDILWQEDIVYNNVLVIISDAALTSSEMDKY